MRGNRNTLLITFRFPTPWLNYDFLRLGRGIIAQLGFRELRNTRQAYGPNKETDGATIVFFLAESHLIIETFREEEQTAELEIVTCRREIETLKVAEVLARHQCEILGVTLLKKQENDQWRPC